jgi:hypothetical protein
MRLNRMTIARVHLTHMVGFICAILGGFIYTLDPRFGGEVCLRGYNGPDTKCSRSSAGCGS